MLDEKTKTTFVGRKESTAKMKDNFENKDEKRKNRPFRGPFFYLDYVKKLYLIVDSRRYKIQNGMILDFKDIRI